MKDSESPRPDKDGEPRPDTGGSSVSAVESSGSGLEVDDDASDGSQYDIRSTYPLATMRRTVSTPFDTETFNTSTRSLYEGDLDYDFENGRRYAQDYFMPNDEDEQSRLQIMHQVFLSFFNSQLTTVPLVAPTKILDIGTGTGEWAIGMGEAFPNADVIGTDLSAIQPSAVPSNVYFEIWDAEEDEQWTEPAQSCDLIHFRSMSGSFQSWETIYQRTLEYLKPGGYIEVLDCDPAHSTFSRFWSSDSEIRTWWMAVSDAMLRTGRDFTPLNAAVERLQSAGFVDVHMEEYSIPLGTWPTDPEAKSTAKLWLLTVIAGLEATSLRPLTRNGWEAAEVRRVCDEVGGQLKRVALDPERAEGMAITAKVLTGRKPRVGEQRTEGEAALVQTQQSGRHKRGASSDANDGEGSGRQGSRFLRLPNDDNDRTSEDTMTPGRM